MPLLEDLTTAVGEVGGTRAYGRVRGVNGLAIEVSGPVEHMAIGARVAIDVAGRAAVPCEVVGFRGDRAVVGEMGHHRI